MSTPTDNAAVGGFHVGVTASRGGGDLQSVDDGARGCGLAAGLFLPGRLGSAVLGQCFFEVVTHGVPRP